LECFETDPLADAVAGGVMNGFVFQENTLSGGRQELPGCVLGEASDCHLFLQGLLRCNSTETGENVNRFSPTSL
jgi:hypothetical protein